jgi:hypothetical protein
LEARAVILLESEFFSWTNNTDEIVEQFSPLETTINVTSSLWLETGELQLQTRIRLDNFDLGNPAYSARFLNPTSSQFGWINLLTDGYLVERHRIEAPKQQITIDSPPITIFGARPSLPRRYARDEDTGDSHFYTISDTPICLAGTLAILPAPAPSEWFGQGTMPGGSICMRGNPGSESMIEVDIWPPGTQHQVTIDRLGENMLTAISGVVYPRTGVSILVETFYTTAINSTPIPPIPAIINGNAPFPIYGFGCALGVPIPAPSNPQCGPSDIQSNGGGSYSCPAVP